MNSAIQIGLSPAAVAEAHKTIVSILKSSTSEKVKLSALKVLEKGLAINNTTVSSCTFFGDNNSHHAKPQTSKSWWEWWK